MNKQRRDSIAEIDALGTTVDEHAGASSKSVRAVETATAEEISKARSTYGEAGELEIDDNALVSRGEEIAWVQAWVALDGA